MSQIYDQFKSIIEKDSQTEKKRRDLYQTHFISSYRRSQKNGFQRGSERTICSSKCPSRTAKGGAGPVLLPVPIYATPRQAYNSYLLTKFNGVAVPTHAPGSHQSRHTIPTKKRMLPGRAASSDYLLGSILIHF